MPALSGDRTPLSAHTSPSVCTPYIAGKMMIYVGLSNHFIIYAVYVFCIPPAVERKQTTVLSGND